MVSDSYKKRWVYNLQRTGKAWLQWYQERMSNVYILKLFSRLIIEENPTDRTLHSPIVDFQLLSFCIQHPGMSIVFLTIFIKKIIPITSTLLIIRYPDLIHYDIRRIQVIKSKPLPLHTSLPTRTRSPTTWWSWWTSTRITTVSQRWWTTPAWSGCPPESSPTWSATYLRIPVLRVWHHLQHQESRQVLLCRRHQNTLTTSCPAS